MLAARRTSRGHPHEVLERYGLHYGVPQVTGYTGQTVVVYRYRASINHGRNMDETWTIHGQLTKIARGTWGQDDEWVTLTNRGDWGWLGQVLVGTGPLSAKRIDRWRN